MSPLEPTLFEAPSYWWWFSWAPKWSGSNSFPSSQPCEQPLCHWSSFWSYRRCYCFCSSGWTWRRWENSIVSFFLFFSSESFFLGWEHLLDLWPLWWHFEQVTVDSFSSFFTMSSRLSWEGWTLLSMILPFNLAKSFMSLCTSCLSSSFSLAMRSSQDFATTSSKHFSLQGLDSSIESMQEVESLVSSFQRVINFCNALNF